MSAFIGIALSPFLTLIILLIFRPLTNALRYRMNEGPLKRVLFFTWR